MFPQAEWEPAQWENVSWEGRECIQSKINFKDIKKKGVGVGQRGWGEGKEILQKKKKERRNEIWSGFNLCQLANKSLKAVPSMDSPSVM